MGRGVSWGDEDIALLGDELAKGTTAYQVAKKHGWPYSSVKKAVQKLECGESLNQYVGKRDLEWTSDDNKALDMQRKANRKHNIAGLVNFAKKKLGKSVSWSTMQRMVTKEYKPVRPMQCQAISPRNVARRVLWAREVLIRTGLRRGVMARKGAKIPWPRIE